MKIKKVKKKTTLFSEKQVAIKVYNLNKLIDQGNISFVNRIYFHCFLIIITLFVHRKYTFNIKLFFHMSVTLCNTYKVLNAISNKLTL